MILLGLLTAIGLLSLELRALLTRRRRSPWERLLCLPADYLPTIFLAVSLMFLLSFQPFAQYFEQWREVDRSVWFSRYWSGAQPLAISAHGLSYFFSQGWVLAIVALSLLALFIIVRGLLPASRRLDTPSWRTQLDDVTNGNRESWFPPG